MNNFLIYSAVTCLTISILPINAFPCDCGCGCDITSIIDQCSQFSEKPIEYYTSDNLDELYQDIREASLVQSEHVWDLLDRMKLVDPNCPVMTQMKDGSILFKGGFPMNDTEKKEMAKFMKGMGMCESIEDVHFLGDVDVHVETTISKKKAL